jgi:uncharacterized protein DUF222
LARALEQAEADAPPAGSVAARIAGGLQVSIGASPEQLPTWWAERAQDLPPNGRLLDLVDDMPFEHLSGDQALSVAIAAERLVARAQAVQLQALARFAQLRPASFGDDKAAYGDRDLHRYAPDEVACALAISLRAAGQKLALAMTLTQRLPQTLRTLHTGRIDVAKARAIADRTASLTETQARAVERHVLPRAERQTYSQVRAATGRAATRLNPELAARRRKAGVAARRVALLPQDGGVSDLWARLPAEVAAACYDRVTQLAATARTPQDQRTGEQRRADVFADLLLGTTTGGGYQAQIVVLTKETSLLRLDDEPGELLGSGALPAEVVRKIAEQHPRSVWRRMLTDPVTGAAKDLERTRYRPSAALDEFVRMRAQVCYFPGCQRPAHRCDMDHLTAFANGGATNADNLGPACRHHHPLTDGRLPKWTVTQPQPGVYEVTSPTGRVYRGDPQPLLEPPEPDDHPPPA